ncbi:putative RNA-directed DNA polymerase from transposon BS [Trichonephila clavipes]|nr:putative RNA-directed DNA polymerase from transposon BS [Trichonephila clavipes]
MSWKTAVVIPILKPDKNSALAESYRPISLLPVLSKLAEKVILARLNDHLERENILIPEQHGFRPRLSTSHQLNLTTRGFLVTDHVILNHGHVTLTTPELALSSRLPPLTLLLHSPTNGRTFKLTTDLTCIVPSLNGGFSVALSSSSCQASQDPIPRPLDYCVHQDLNREGLE